MSKEEIFQQGKIRIISIIQNACLGAFLSGYTGAELSYAFDAVKENLQLNQNEYLYNIIFTVSIILGSFLGTVLYSQLHQYSTKRIIMVMADLIFIASVTFRFDTWEAFALQRFLKGISNGLNLCSGLVYIREICPDDFSSKAICIFQINVNMGIVLANLISMPLQSNQSSSQGEKTSQYWKFVFCFPLLIALIRAYVLIFIFDFDTPFSYYQQEHIHKGQKLLKKLYFPDESQVIFETYRNYQEDQQPTFKVRWINAAIVFAIQQMCGINSIIQQSNTSINQYTQNKQTIAILQLFMNLILLSMAILTYFLIDKYTQRIQKSMMTLGCTLLGFSLIAMVLLQKIEISQIYQIINVAAYFIIFNSTLGPVTLIYIADISKDNVMSLGFYSYWITYMLSQGLQMTNNSFIPLIFAFSCFLGAYYYYTFWYPTKGRIFYDINIQLNTYQTFYKQLFQGFQLEETTQKDKQN
ncbi:hypothetical protein ABPG72_013824 [Tetrahymena utriculariae]